MSDTFHIGDLIEAILDGSEIEGEIVSISDSGLQAKIKTPYGVFTADLSTAKKLTAGDDLYIDDVSDEYPYHIITQHIDD